MGVLAVRDIFFYVISLPISELGSVYFFDGEERWILQSNLAVFSASKLPQVDFSSSSKSSSPTNAAYISFESLPWKGQNPTVNL